jgi:uncharacterized repeat protein (TIGR03803 family)
MRSMTFCAAAVCIVAAVALIPVFSADASHAASEKVLYSFTGGASGEFPYSDLTLDAAGNLYGTTSGGGYTGGEYCQNTGCGVVFELQPTQTGWTEKVLYSFQGGLDGRFPANGVIFDSAGNLYGTTQGNGQQNQTVFELTPNSQGGWTESVLHIFTLGSFPAPYPQAGLVFDTKGNLYGAMGQIIFELIPQKNGSWQEVTIHQFNGAPDGAAPTSLSLDDSGHIYGMTQEGGTGKCDEYYALGCGIVYKLAPRAHENWDETVLYNFPRGGGYGINPSGALMLDPRGYLLGSTLYGGDGLGTIFQLKESPKGLTQNILYRFYGDPDGAFPVGKMAVNADGVLYGVTSDGGSGGLRSGAVFAMERLQNHEFRERVIHSFGIGTDGLYPQSGVVLDSQGNLYGTTERGGTATGGLGTVYEITP